MLNASEDPKATRRYRAAGFTLHPQMYLRGTVDRSVLPVVEHVREGSAGDIDLMDSIDRRTRGAAHGSDHLVLIEGFRLLVTDRPAGSGTSTYVRTAHRRCSRRPTGVPRRRSPGRCSRPPRPTSR